MTVYFKKIDSSIFPTALIDPDSIKGELKFHYGHPRYFEISDKDYVESLKKVFKIPPVNFYLVEGHGVLPPHFDHGQDSCLNFYIRPGGYTTSFWKLKENAKNRVSIKYDAKTNTTKEVNTGYYYEDLILIDQFQAIAGEAYVLNISEIHSVEGANPEKPRAFVQLQWNMTMDQLLKSLNFNGNNNENL
jgi:hypothetical protein